MDTLFDMSALDTTAIYVACSACPLNNAMGNKTLPPVLVKNGTTSQSLLIIGDEPLRKDEESSRRVFRGVLAPYLSQLPEEFCVYYTPPFACPPNNSGRLSDAAVCCRGNVALAIKQVAPQYIVCFGENAISALYRGSHLSNCMPELLRSNVIPDRDYSALVVPTFSFHLEGVQNEQNIISSFIAQDLAQINPFERYLPIEPKEIILDDSILHSLEAGDIIAIDYETTGLKPDNAGHYIYSVSVCETESDTAYSFLLTEKNIALWKSILSNGLILKVGHNIKMEERWSRTILDTPVRGWIWDTCIAAHCFNSYPGGSGLKFQAFVNFGAADYSKEISKYLSADNANAINHIEKAPVEMVLKYGAYDAFYTARLAKKQIPLAKKTKLLYNNSLFDGIKFFTTVQRAFAVMEGVGVGINTKLMQEHTDAITKELETLQEKIQKTKLYQTWSKRYRGQMSLGASKQLRTVLYETLKIDVPKTTLGGESAIDADALSDIQLDGIPELIKMRKYDKVLNTYYAQFKRELSDNNVLHCEMRLNTTRTYRTSCTNPNLQNINRADKEMSQLVRSVFVPQFDGYCLVEADLKGCEVSGAACHTKDPNLIAYVSDSSLDMHRDIGEILYKVDKSLISKDLRSVTKSYTFGSFYGSYYKLTAPHVYKQLQTLRPTLTDGTPIFDHLESKGIHTLEAFTDNTQMADDYFWNQQFPGYTRWKKEMWEGYLQNGFVDMFTGFRRYGPLSRNQVINTPIQGDSGHINLWLCGYVLSRIAKDNLQAKLFLQIHDSVVGFVHESCLDKYCSYYTDGIAKLRSMWKWMICPFPVEFEVAPVGASWYDKKEYITK